MSNPTAKEQVVRGVKTTVTQLNQVLWKGRMNAFPREGDWLSIDPDSGSYLVSSLTFCVPTKKDEEEVIIRVRPT